MKKRNLPKNYKGYPTDDLLDIWDQIANRDGIVPGTPREKIRAMNRFLREYEIAPVYKVAAQVGIKNSATTCLNA
ncbi:MAG TPA: hypothetical protein ENK58_04135 [Desulfobacterales bacterium]|nr:MAG: hypothetical protein DRI57_07255 [Deltaproteobacteria bacterium]HHC24590.1 hypothetical protein [Desulfobacterales bacterium]